MKWSNFLKDKSFFLITFFLFQIILFLLLNAFHIPKELILVLCIVFFIFFFFNLINEYYRKKSFYQTLLFQIKELDKSFLVLEVIEEPNFLEGKLLYQALYEINKSMIENMKKYETQTKNFKDFIEMWIHEIKIPLATLELLNHNQKQIISKKIKKQITRLEDNVEKVLYYTRQELAENDYLIKENNLNQIINTVAMKNKDDLLENKIDFSCENLDINVLTDSKWLEFIVNQIINNSIKYRSLKSAKIKIKATKEKDKICLSIYDNGIGIPLKDQSKVFQKTFTGINGRIKEKSTGMGLYIAKQLCNKLGHNIEIISEEKKFTEVRIYFYQNKYYDVLK